MGNEEGPDTSKESSDDQVDDARQQEADGDGEDLDIGEGDQDGDNEEDGKEEEEDQEEEEEDGYEEDEKDTEIEEEVEEDESDVVPHHSGDDTIGLDPPSLPSQEEKDPIRGLDSSPHRTMPIVQRQYEHRDPSGSQSQAVSFHDPYQRDEDLGNVFNL